MNWAVFDYGAGNIHSIHKALVRAGADVHITDDALAAADAEVTVLPGVGAFGHVMDRLAPAVDALRQRHADGRPILGICIGMQALYEASEEAPSMPGLGILAGTVKRLPAGAGKVPHMGWNTLDATGPMQPWHGKHVYYVHSYAAAPGPATMATTEYGTTFAAAARDRNTIAVQFHPEKSGHVGAAMLASIVTDVEAA